METAKRCPYCTSLRIKLEEGMFRIRVIPVVTDGPGEERKFPVYRCLHCGRSFDEIEAGEHNWQS